MHKKPWKHTPIGIWQNPELISHVPLRSLNIPSLKALTEKLTTGMPRMPKSHNRPLCTYLMKYDADTESHPRSWPKWHIYQVSLKSNETIQVSIQTPNTHDRAPRFIKKSIKIWENYKYWNSAESMTDVPIQSLNIWSLKALAGKLTSGMPKMPKSHDRPLWAYFNPVQDLVPSDTYTKKEWNPMKRIWVIIRTLTRTDGRINGANPVYFTQCRRGQGYGKLLKAADDDAGNLQSVFLKRLYLFHICIFSFFLFNTILTII